MRASAIEILLSISLTAIGAASLAAQTVADLGNAPGSFFPGGSLPATRSVDVSVLSADEQTIERLFVHGISFSGSGSAMVGARIWDPTTNDLLACGETMISALGGGLATARVPIVFSFAPGVVYRVGCYVQPMAIAVVTQTRFQPSSLPYVESTGVFRIEQIHTGSGDAFPTSITSFAPWLSIEHLPHAIDSNVVLGAIGGTPINGQSFANQSRAVDVTPRIGHRRITRMQLDGLNIFALPAIVGARIYDATSHALIASGFVGVAATGTSLTAIVPIDALLYEGQTYRVGFTVFAPAANANFLNSVTFPYTEDQGVFEIRGAWATIGDAFPDLTNVLLPRMTIRSERIQTGSNQNLGTAVGGVATPTLTSCTTPTIGRTLRLDVANGGAAANASLLVAITATPTQVPAFGLLILADPPVATPTVPLASGAGSWSLAIPDLVGLIGVSLASQAFVIDATSPADLPLSHSDILLSTIGH